MSRSGHYCDSVSGRWSQGLSSLRRAPGIPIKPVSLETEEIRVRLLVIREKEGPSVYLYPSSRPQNTWQPDARMYTTVLAPYACMAAARSDVHMIINSRLESWES